MGKFSSILSNFIKRFRFIAVSALMVLSTALAGTIVTIPVNSPSVSAATNCPQDSTPQYNIIYCGLSGTGYTTSQYISSLQGYYNANNDGHGNHDIQTVLNWAGASPAMIAGMNTSNTVIGTAYNNGTITVNGQLVGTNSIVSARWNPGGPGYTHLEGNVWYRNATTSFAPTPSVLVLVHLNSYGQADFAVMLECGNVMQFHPMPPKPVLVCDSLTQAEVGTTLEYTFTAKATAQNTAISSYTFNFGDNSTATKVNTSSTTATTNHTYSNYSTSYTANVLVNGSVTSANCQVKLTTPPAPVKHSLACVELTATPVSKSSLDYTFTAKAAAQNTPITSYTFNFGDSSAATKVNTSNTTATTDHTYGKYNTTYTANVLVNGSVTSANCQVKLTTPPTPVKPTLACVQLTASPVGKSTTDYTFTAQASAVKTTITGYNFNFGDNSTPTRVESNSTSVSTGHTYSAPGTYTASVTVTGSNNQTATSKDCEVNINIPTTPTTPTPPVQLVNTGPGDMLGIVGIVTVVGAIAHNLFMRRFANKAN